ncbi:thrombospondin type 3 repeat-containing protein [Candidatus Berkiella aquae]|uniref:Thrombospondin type 3 repeat-containing protein n=1 Tax=Candidatus Berkiella aquae TaxID=295108 RepID=A0A0Q9YWD8_9GAMM|nr:thrombospondin type 3 repeat-containing protein [Candidatus Berkiella aquae]MCS5710100.1 thrombospondin type 3 repeat-containing protein [Candidatus Berkiella aquae]
MKPILPVIIMLFGTFYANTLLARDVIVPYQPRFTKDAERWNDPGPAKTPGEWVHPSQRDNDNDGIPNYQDKDDDNDGIPDNVDKQQYRK